MEWDFAASENSVSIESIDVIPQQACRLSPSMLTLCRLFVFFPAKLGTLPCCPASRDSGLASSASSARTLRPRSPASLANCRPDLLGLVVSPMERLALLRPRSPATVISWNRKGFRLYWTWKRRVRQGTSVADVARSHPKITLPANADKHMLHGSGHCKLDR